MEEEKTRGIEVKQSIMKEEGVGITTTIQPTAVSGDIVIGCSCGKKIKVKIRYDVEED